MSGVCCPRRKVITVEDWIFAENLQPFVEVLANLAGYTLYDDEYDWVAIDYGLKDTDADEDKWYSYPLAGTRPLTLQVARDVGSKVVSVRVSAEGVMSADVAAQLRLLVMLCQDYRIAARRSGPVR